MDLRRLFTEHPASVGESYWGHLLRASWFSARLLLAGSACLVHAVLPFLFVKTGSQAITELYGAMVTGRRVAPPSPQLTVRRVAN
ncbi:MAG: hypothetical protein JOY91_08360 [Sinobacteraceae bacterium]|nr:hypothetical protein [Nevskiaceae bacterium]